ncbi:hypothetical protein GA0061070_101841 [Kosakonia oryziphila]|uniref:Uncharacterized protein n=1 Tax=Kosakonia oryziphila TaxID=1005667 RepID=A0A1C4DSZ1_9ENTR|nr:hypothetical protein GA0061070_101841 [Kosakonia oryziphila]
MPDDGYALSGFVLSFLCSRAGGTGQFSPPRPQAFYSALFCRFAGRRSAIAIQLKSLQLLSRF